MKNLKQTGKRILCAVLLAVLLAGTAVPVVAQRGMTYVCMTQGLRIRRAAKSGSVIIGKMNKGQKALHLSSKNGWWRVRVAGGVVGYVWPSYLRKAGSSICRKNAFYKVKSAATVRQAPRTVATKVGKLKKGKVVKLIGMQGSWGKVKAGGAKTGWVLLKKLAYYSG